MHDLAFGRDVHAGEHRAAKTAAIAAEDVKAGRTAVDSAISQANAGKTVTAVGGKTAATGAGASETSPCPLLEKKEGKTALYKLLSKDSDLNALREGIPISAAIPN